MSVHVVNYISNLKPTCQPRLVGDRRFHYTAL